LSYRPEGAPPGFFMKAGLGMAAGVVGAFVGTPAEVRQSISVPIINVLISLLL
jgi:hypothetical protein